jgi:hypothetical protein
MAYGNSWWVWWTACQPSWRIVTPDTKGFIPSNGHGDWSSLGKGGKNGMILHVMTLAWCSNTALNNAKGMKKWVAAVKEVAWALHHMHTSHKSSCNGTHLALFSLD